MARVQANLGEFGWLVGAALAMTACSGSSRRAPELPSAAPPSANPQQANAPLTTRASALAETSWLTNAQPDLRKLTVLIRAKPPNDLIAKYLEIAHRNQRVKEFFEAAADGAFGSGLVVVRRSAPGDVAQRFIVTNRHVVDLASWVTVSFEDDKQTFEIPVVYLDQQYDLAILSLNLAAKDTERALAIAPSGFDFETKPAKDQQPVVASGYPGIGKMPSYQVTRGYVSNERFEFKEQGRSLLYVQHTAAIDPGSSGGPLLTPDGKVLGVNTLKVRRRENVGLAVPAEAVIAALARIGNVKLNADEPGPPQVALASCNELLAALARGEDGLRSVENAIGGPMLARDGFASLDALPEHEDVDWLQAFLESPTDVFLHAIALRLLSEVAPRSTTNDMVTCSAVPNLEGAGTATFEVPTRRGKRVWKFGWEQRRYKLLQGSLASTKRNERFFSDPGTSKRSGKKWTPSLK